MARRWYVVQTKHNHEKLAAQELLNQNFTTFLPLHHSTKLNLDVPLFPSYLFVEFDWRRNKRWPRIKNTRGVKALVACSETFLTPLPQGYIEKLIKLADKRGVINLERLTAPPQRRKLKLIEGQSVEVCKGAFAGQLATYCNSRQNMATVLLALLGKQTALILPHNALRNPTNDRGLR